MKVGRKPKYKNKFSFNFKCERALWDQLIDRMKNDTSYYGERNATAYLQYLVQKQVEEVHDNE